MRLAKHIDPSAQEIGATNSTIRLNIASPDMSPPDSELKDKKTIPENPRMSDRASPRLMVLPCKITPRRAAQSGIDPKSKAANPESACCAAQTIQACPPTHKKDPVTMRGRMSPGATRTECRRRRPRPSKMHPASPRRNVASMNGGNPV